MELRVCLHADGPWLTLPGAELCSDGLVTLALTETLDTDWFQLEVISSETLFSWFFLSLC